MKKYLVFSVIFLTSFLLISNVKAATTEITLNTAIDQKELLNNFFATKEEIGVDETSFQNAIKAFNIDTDKYDYIIAYRKNSSTSKILRCYKWEKTSTFKAEPSISFLDYTGNQNYYWFTFVLKISSGKSYTIDYELVNNKLDWSINYVPIENDIVAFNYDSNKKLKYNRSAYRILETSIDLKFGTSASYDFSSNGYNPKRIKDFMIDDGELCYSIKKGDILFDKDLTPSWIPKTHSYENTINVKDLSKIEFNFKLPSESVFSYDLDLLTQFSESEFFMPKPYLVYQSIFDDKDISQADDFLGDLTKVGATDEYNNELYEYSGQFGIDFSNLKQLKLVFDVSDYNYNLYIKFTSSLDYEITTISYEEEKQYFTTIEMDDKYGLYLIPRTLSSDNLNNIVLKGKYNIEIRNNYTSSDKYDVLKKYINYTENSLNYKYTFDNLNYLIYFENVDYQTNNDDGYFITFDSRFYNYVVKENIYDSPIINNPNTNEDIKLPSTDFITGDKEDNSQSFLHNITNFLNSLRSYSKYYDELFKKINEVYTTMRNSKVGTYIFILVSGSIIILLIKGIKN